MQELLSYQVEKVEREFEAYVLSDRNGPRYALWRNKVIPHMLFAVHMRPGKMGVAKIKGYSWFTDKDGNLRPSR